MTPEAEARQQIDERLQKAGWIVQSLKQLNLSAGQGVAVREFPTSTGPVDYALFVNGIPVGVIEAKDWSGEVLLASAKGMKPKSSISKSLRALPSAPLPASMD